MLPELLHHLSLASLAALLQVVLIDVTLAGDNAVVVGLAVAGLPAGVRRRAILFGVLAATAIRIALASVVVSLLAVIGLTLAGGLLLLWVCWRMLRELRARHRASRGEPAARKTLTQAVTQIIIADLSMSLDNVLAVAGVARLHVWVLVVGLALSVGLMGLAAGLLARLLERHRWIAWVGLLVVVVVALRMIADGWHEVLPELAGWARRAGLPSAWRAAVSGAPNWLARACRVTLQWARQLGAAVFSWAGQAADRLRSALHAGS